MLKVLPIVLLISMSGGAPEAASVRGSVLSEGSDVPLGRVELFLVSDSSPVGQPLTTTSKQDGRFEFGAVEPGHYLILEEPEWRQYAKYGKDSRVDLSHRAVDVLPRGNPPDTVIHLQVGNILEGHITDENNAPIAGLEVTPLVFLDSNGFRQWVPKRSGTTTWPDGTYQITGLRGKVVLEVQAVHEVNEAPKRADNSPVENSTASSSKGFVQTFYPAALDAKSATPIDIEGEQALLRNLDIQMQRGSLYSIRGVIANGGVGRRYTIHIERGTDVSTLRMLQTSPDNSFEVDDLPSGEYRLELLDNSPGQRRAGPSVIAFTKMQLKDRNVDDVRLTIKEAASVTAHLTVTESFDSGNIKLFLRPTSNPTAPIVLSTRSADGIYTFENVSSEPNQLTALNLPPGISILNVSFNGQQVKNAVVDLTDGGGQIDISSELPRRHD